MCTAAIKKEDIKYTDLLMIIHFWALERGFFFLKNFVVFKTWNTFTPGLLTMLKYFPVVSDSS